MLKGKYGRCLIPTDVELDENGRVWALWTFNPFLQKVGLWNIPELKASNEPSEVDRVVSLLICGLPLGKE